MLPREPRERKHGIRVGLLSILFVAAPTSTERHRENQLVTTVDLHPELLGIGIDEGAAIVVPHNTFRIVGRGRVAIYDNERHGSRWFYYLDPDAVFDLGTRTVQPPSP